jgi:hypothetical protein
MDALPRSGNSDSGSLQRIVDAFLSQPELPFANVLSAERIRRIFAATATSSCKNPAACCGPNCETSHSACNQTLDRDSAIQS